MSRESRLIAIFGLTVCLIGGLGLLKDGGFVFPFPINSFFFLLAAAQYTIWNYKKGLPVFLFLFAAIFGVLANPVFWEVVFPAERLDYFVHNEPWIIWFEFLSGLGILSSGIYLIWKQKKHFTALITVAGLTFYGIGFQSLLGVYTLIGFGLIMLSVLIRPTYRPIHLLWVLLFMLELSEWLTFTFA